MYILIFTRILKKIRLLNVEKQLRKKFDTRYKKITDTEPEEIYYKEYVKYARDRFNKDNPIETRSRPGSIILDNLDLLIRRSW